MDINRLVVKLVTRAHSAVYRASSGRIGGTLGGAENVLLTTTGRKSGQARTTPLVAVPDGERIVLVASFGGAPKHPDWYFNLSTNPDVMIQRGGERIPMRARTAGEIERAQLWPKVIAAFKGYDNYQKKTDREIPVVICEPVAANQEP
jgi:deazaflavin-dependent oxidoreductase (nitroreductase family)